MHYDYNTEKAFIFTDAGQRMFLAIRDHTDALLRSSGAVTMACAISADVTGDSWQMIACVDRRVELGELHEIEQLVPVSSDHDRIFVSTRSAR